MRPIKLELKNFGPFINETIHFDELNQQQLFLISGRTGSGKTILFDAMTYALYGEASTKDRDKNALRSQFAASDEVSSVTFTFKVRGATYVAERQLPYKKPGNKNLTDTKFQLKDITSDDKLLAARPSEGKQAVLDIMKVDANQFRQILILPQGEFKRFLVSSSSQKQPVLRTLFSTDRFRQLEEKLTAETKELDATVQKMENQIYMHLEQLKIDADVTGSIELQLSHYKNEQINLLAELSHLSSDLTALRTKEKEQQVNVETARQLEDWYKEAAQLEQERDELKAQEKVINQKKEQLLKYQVLERLAEMNNQLIKLKQKSTDWTAELDSLTHQSAEQSAQLEQHKETLSQLKVQDEAICQAITARDNLRHYINDDDWRHLKEKLNTEKNSCTELTANLAASQVSSSEELYEQLQQSHKQRQQLSETLQNLQLQYSTVQSDIKNKEQHNEKVAERHQYEEELKTITIDDRASYAAEVFVVRQHVHVGDQCPVCQQLIHTLPDAQDEAEALKEQQQYKEQLRKKIRLESLIEQLQHMTLIDVSDDKEKLQQLQNDIDKLKETQRGVDESTAAFEKEYQAALTSQKSYAELKAAVQQSEREVLYLEDRWKKFVLDTGFQTFNDFEQSFEQREQQINAYQKQVSELERQINQEENGLKVKQSERSRLHDLISDEKAEAEVTEKKLSDELQKYHLTADDLADEIDGMRSETLQKEIEIYKQSVHGVEVKLDSLKSNIAGRDLMKTAVLEEQLVQLKQNLNDKQEKETTLKIRCEDNQQLLNQISALYEDYLAQVDSQKELLDLSRLLGGKNQHHLTLENYVLAYYLDQTLKLSNLRLSDMTHHRYQFRRKQTKSQGYSGLDIEIFDHYSNQVRDITTLSGGETFLASLSLALGLSDYVTQLSGGISLESVFIDEGFGTLDNETLETAIECLVELERSGKMVGLISHVAMLKDRIPAILHVESSGYLSTTHFSVK
ncbi:SMC family ATPase [Macrococcus hajekii]|uniref:Nuclease SbcCD subunit C n=1 Tax=Macrococcus hajekii TaxID=198482 RepID=A0A4R6BN12_9STAP|nr:SMC family ATPase [Macrococcus hajekii]TDM03082.1 SMC family ATPase [Macrococcus hajekii]GGB06394.1 nuclease SbcCD subunit C [Macrococcus hajekii]